MFYIATVDLKIKLLTSTTIDLLEDLCKLVGDMSGVVIQHRRVAVADLSKEVQNDDLGGKVRHSSGGLFLGVGGNVSSSEDFVKLKIYI